jgi:hypothetical protein
MEGDTSNDPNIEPGVEPSTLEQFATGFGPVNNLLVGGFLSVAGGVSASMYTLAPTSDLCI